MTTTAKQKLDEAIMPPSEYNSPIKALGTMHYQLSDQEHAAISEAKRKGAHYDLPEMLCRTGDGHRQGTRDWDIVNCPRCLQTGKTWRKYSGDAT